MANTRQTKICTAERLPTSATLQQARTRICTVTGLNSNSIIIYFFMSWTDQDHRRLSNSSGADDGVVTRAASARSYPHQCTRLRLFGQSCIYISTTKLFWRKKIICGRNSLKILFEIELIKNGMNIDHTWPKLAPNMTFLSGFASGHARVSRGWWGVPGAKIFPKHDAYQTRRGIQHNHQMGQQESSFRSVTAVT